MRISDLRRSDLGVIRHSDLDEPLLISSRAGSKHSANRSDDEFRKTGDALSGHSRGSDSITSPLIDEAVESGVEEMKEYDAPNMWALNNVGLYCQYASVGLLYGMSGSVSTFCFYKFKGDPNVCANANNVVFFAWSFKIVYAVISDVWHPFGYRRKSWMLFGWTLVLLILAGIAYDVDSLSASTWLKALLFVQAAAMFSDVPADGYSVELGQRESPATRGQILATGQLVRFSFSVIAGLIQTFLLNGLSTNPPGCKIGFGECWSFGLTVQQYYELIFCMVGVLTIPIFFLKEIDSSQTKERDFSEHFKEIWETMKNLTQLNIIIFVIGISIFTGFLNIANVYVQYELIQLTNFETGIDSVSTYMFLVFAIYIFKRYLIRRNWRTIQYGSVTFGALLGLLWVPAYFDLVSKSVVPRFYCSSTFYSALILPTSGRHFESVVHHIY
jgi:hypothetical protein